MNSAKLNDWLALLANLGIVAGLVIVYLELDHANRLAEANAMQARDAEIVQAQKDYALSDYMPEIVVKAQENGFDSLTAVEVSRYHQWEMARLQRLYAAYRQYEMGFMSRDTIDSTVRRAIDQGWIDTWINLGITFNRDELMIRNDSFGQDLLEAHEAAKNRP